MKGSTAMKEKGRESYTEYHRFLGKYKKYWFFLWAEQVCAPTEYQVDHQMGLTVGTKNFERSCGKVEEMLSMGILKPEIFEQIEVGRSLPGEDLNYPNDNYGKGG
ncbi:hypothetical protein HZH66_013670 [Vespula vulgaris]|uniref:Uncharacterized protein n=1 Tax=Vespula vulgaris TaxID=7454 RepID=A0A834J632_VESVU|nr:hypothetical protein HZH66_013670 [Vespula vulgaris]